MNPPEFIGDWAGIIVTTAAAGVVLWRVLRWSRNNIERGVRVAVVEIVKPDLDAVRNLIEKELLVNGGETIKGQVTQLRVEQMRRGGQLDAMIEKVEGIDSLAETLRANGVLLSNTATSMAAHDAWARRAYDANKPHFERLGLEAIDPPEPPK